LRGYSTDVKLLACNITEVAFGLKVTLHNDQRPPLRPWPFLKLAETVLPPKRGGHDPCPLALATQSVRAAHALTLDFTVRAPTIA
jgi:hypothetical protein